jgi:hypothetical protein
VSSSPVYSYPRVSRAISGCTLRFMKLFGPQPGFPQHLDLRQQLGQLESFLHRRLRVPPWPVLGLLPTGLRQLRVVVRDVEPLGLPVLIGIYQLVGEVLLCRVLPHLDPRSTDYSGIADAGLRLHLEELPERDPMGLDPQESFAKM